MNYVRNLTISIVLLFSLPGHSISQQIQVEKINPLITALPLEQDTSKRIELLKNFYSELSDLTEALGAKISDQSDAGAVDPDMDSELTSLIEMQVYLQDILHEISAPLTRKKCIDTRDTMAFQAQVTVQQMNRRKVWIELQIPYDLLNAACSNVTE